MHFNYINNNKIGFSFDLLAETVVKILPTVTRDFIYRDPKNKNTLFLKQGNDNLNYINR